MAMDDISLVLDAIRTCPVDEALIILRQLIAESKSVSRRKALAEAAVVCKFWGEAGREIAEILDGR